MSRPVRKGVKEARNQLAALLDEAQKGRTTIITRHGRSIAAIVPVEGWSSPRQKPLNAVAGTGKGLWGKQSAATVGRLRKEWER